MSITDITLAYLWFTLAAFCILLLRRFLDPEVQGSWGKLKQVWRNLDSADERQRDRPDQGPLSSKLGRLHKKGTGPPSVAGSTFVPLLTILRPIAFFGLLIALLRSVGEPPDWSLGLGDLILSGTSGSLVFFCLFVVSIWGRLYFRMPGREPRTWFDAKILPMWRWIVEITLPICSILIWAGS